MVNSTRGTLEEVSLQGLLPGTMYSVRVVAHNEHGPGQSSPALDITTQSEVAVPGPPSNLAARATSSFSILIEWNAPREEVQRYKLYYRRVSSFTYVKTFMSSLGKFNQWRMGNLPP